MIFQFTPRLDECMNNIDYKTARQFLEKKEQIRLQLFDKRYDQACNDFEKIIRFIIEKYKPEPIYQSGSLVQRKNFSEFSDIDIALEGITSAEHLFEMYGAIMDMTDFPIDLVQIEKIEPEFADLIKTKGKIVYERNR